MEKEYLMKRKLLKFQDNKEGEGSFFVTLPKLWVNSENLKKGDQLTVSFNGVVKVIPPNKEAAQ